LVGTLKSGEPVDWEDAEVKRIMDTCRFYNEMGLVDYSADLVTMYETLMTKIKATRKNIKEIINKIIKNTKGMRYYMIMHSVFPVNAMEENDWLVKLMLEILDPTDKDIQWFIRKPAFIPADIMSSLSCFDPEVLTVSVDTIRIEYQLYKSRNPINVIDTDFEKITGLKPDDEVRAHETDILSTYDVQDFDLPF
jgi:hypothetical protein